MGLKNVGNTCWFSAVIQVRPPSPTGGSWVGRSCQDHVLDKIMSNTVWTFSIRSLTSFRLRKRSSPFRLIPSYLGRWSTGFACYSQLGWMVLLQ